MALKYTEETIKHFTSPKNLGDVADANAEATEGSPACGDMVKYTLKINPETLIIEDIKFRSYGCASNIATASVATEMAKGKHIDEVKLMGTAEAADKLGGLPAVKMHCSVLAINGIKAAIREFEIRTGRASAEKTVISEESVKAVFVDIMHPKHGKSLVENGNLAGVKIDDKNILITISLEADEEIYANNVRDEIVEHLEHLNSGREIMVKIESRNGEFV